MGTDTHFKNNRIIRYTFSVASSLTPSLLSLFVSDTSQETHPDTSVAGDARHHMHAQQRDHYCTGKKPTQLQGEQAESDHYNSTCKKPTQLQGKQVESDHCNSIGKKPTQLQGKQAKSEGEMCSIIKLNRLQTSGDLEGASSYYFDHSRHSL